MNVFNTSPVTHSNPSFVLHLLYVFPSVRHHAALITSDKGGGTCFCPCLSVFLSVCLLARLLKNTLVDLDEILHVDRCQDIDELINF